MTKPRRWLAILLSILYPGLGHAYAGAPLRGLAIVVCTLLATVPLLLLHMSAPTISSLAFVLAAAPVILVVVAVDAARVAKTRTRFTARGAVLLVCLAFITVETVLHLGWETWRDRQLAKSYYVPSEAMLPTLLIGDHLYADPRAYQAAFPSRGDIVVFRLARTGSGGLAPYDQNPDLASESFIKRIVGVPGDAIRFDGAVLYVNGEAKTSDPAPETSSGPQGESVQVRPESLDSHDYFVWDQVERKPRSFETVVVEPDRYFMAGDHRDNSNDSRYWGTVHRDDILGRATTLYWSWDNREPWSRMLNPLVVWNLLREKTRWDRIGREIE